MKLTDAELVEKTLQGNKDAFGVLVTKYRGAVHGLAYHITGSFSDAEDLAQEAFIKAYRNLTQIQDKSKFASWLNSLTANLCKSWLRKQKDNVVSVDESSDVSSQIIAFDTPEQALADKEFRASVVKAISALPEKNRLVITLFYLDGLSYKDVADFLDTTVSTVQSRLQRGRKQLKEEMLQMVEEIFDEEKLGTQFTQKVLSEIMESGREHLKARRYDEARAAFQKAVELKPDYAEAHYQLGITWDDVPSQEELDALKRATELKPDYIAAHHELGFAYKTAGKLEEASAAFDESIALCKKTVELHPENAEAYCYLGHTYEEKGMLDEAQAAIQKTLELEPDNAKAQFHMGFFHDAAGQIEKAMEEYKKVFQIEPEGSAAAKAHNNLGVLYAKEGKYKVAIAEMKEAIKISDAYIGHTNLGVNYFYDGQYDEAIFIFEKAIEDGKAHRGIYYFLGRCYAAIGQQKEAIAAFQKTIESWDNSVVYFHLGRAYMDNGQNEEATAAYRKAMRIKNSHPLFLNLATEHHSRVQYNQIVAGFEEFVQLNPEDAEAHYTLSRLYSVGGKQEDAIRELKRATQLDAQFVERAKEVFGQHTFG